MLPITYLYKPHRKSFAFPKLSLGTLHATVCLYVKRILCFITLTFCLTTAYSQESSPQTSTAESEVGGGSDLELLKKASSLSRIDRHESIRLTNELLRISENNKNYPVSAQAHTLLGEMTQQSKNFEQSLHHFLQASLLYKNINDKRNQIAASIDYVEILLAVKRYDQAHKFIDELLPVALKYEDALAIALTLIVKGDGYYQEKRYDDAIVQYTHAHKYLSDDDKVIQSHLGETYKKIAQSYKRLIDRKKTVFFYEKTLDVYTALQNKKLVARTLNTLAEAERYMGNLVIALNYSLRGLEIHEQIDDPVGRVKALVGAGIIYRHIGRYEKSLKHIHEAHLYYKDVNDENNIAKTSNQLGFIYTRLKQYDEARSFYQLSIDLSEKIELKTLASALREMAVIDLDSGDYESAMVMAKKSHKINQRESDKSKGAISARVIANIYRAQKDNAKAVDYYRESLQLATEANSKIYKIKAQTALAGILIGKDTKEAIRLLRKSVELSTQINNNSETLYAYRNFRKAEKSRGNIAESLHYAEKELELTEVIHNEKNSNKLIVEKANLHSHKMEIELESLREKARLGQLELAKKNNEIEIAEKTKTITQLELVKNKYANITLALLLAMCVLLVVFIYRRFVATTKRNKELDKLAARDPLTNCYNRRILFDRLERDLENSEPLDQYCIIMADIDHFKRVNDNHGHSAGDSVLREVANILQACVRQDDVVARFGGEEFCIILNRTSPEQAMRIAENMRYKVENSRFDEVIVTCSFGVTSFQFNAKEPAELIDQADVALYKSKSLGRNQVTLWEQTFKNKK